MTFKEKYDNANKQFKKDLKEVSSVIATMPKSGIYLHVTKKEVLEWAELSVIIYTTSTTLVYNKTIMIIQ